MSERHPKATEEQLTQDTESDAKWMLKGRIDVGQCWPSRCEGAEWVVRRISGEHRDTELGASPAARRTLPLVFQPYRATNHLTASCQYPLVGY